MIQPSDTQALETETEPCVPCLWLQQRSSAIRTHLNTHPATGEPHRAKLRALAESLERAAASEQP